MGAIQNSLNSITATVAGAVVAGEHAKEKKQQREEQGLLAQEQYHEASADLKQLEGESAEAKAVWGDKQAEADILMAKKPGGKGNTKAALQERQKKALSEVEAAERAFNELQDRIEAKKAMISRAEKIMKRTGTWGGVR